MKQGIPAMRAGLLHKARAGVAWSVVVGIGATRGGGGGRRAAVDGVTMHSASQKILQWRALGTGRDAGV